MKQDLSPYKEYSESCFRYSSYSLHLQSDFKKSIFNTKNSTIQQQQPSVCTDSFITVLYIQPVSTYWSLYSTKTSPLCMKALSRSVLSDSVQPHGLQHIRLLCPWNFPGKNTGVGSHFLLQGILPTQGSNLDLPLCRQILYHLSHQGRLTVYKQ